MKQIYFTLFISLFLNALYPQSNSESKLFAKLDSIQGYKNLALLNGIAYREEYRTLNEKHPYFNGRDFKNGSLVYDGQEFSNVKLRYDIFSDILIATIDRSGEEVFIIELISDLVTSFEINAHHFDNLRFANGDHDPGFYEILNEYDCLKIYKKARVKPLEKRDRSRAYYEFEKLSTDYYINTSNSFFEPSSSNLRDKYPEYKDRIRAFFKSNRSQRRSNYERFLKDLGVLIEEFECSNNQR